METDDLCPYCMRDGCAGDPIACPARFEAPLMTAQTLAEVRASTTCGFCFGGGGHRVPCHGCGVVGPIMVSR